MPAKRDEIMTIDELAEYLKISKSTLYKLAVENKLPGTKIGKPGGSTRTPSMSG